MGLRVARSCDDVATTRPCVPVPGVRVARLAGVDPKARSDLRSGQGAQTPAVTGRYVEHVETQKTVSFEQARRADGSFEAGVVWFCQIFGKVLAKVWQSLAAVTRLPSELRQIRNQRSPPLQRWSLLINRE
jgi:hypothetical protein